MAQVHEVLVIKIDANDLLDIKTESERLGIPYQTLIGSILHRYVTDELVDKRELKILKSVNEWPSHPLQSSAFYHRKGSKPMNNFNQIILLFHNLI